MSPMTGHDRRVQSAGEVDAGELDAFLRRFFPAVSDMLE